MVNTDSILQAVAMPMSHTPTGILKVEIMGALLVIGVLVATYGFNRWYRMEYADYLLRKNKEELIEQGIAFNPEDYEPPLRSHIVNYIFIGLGVFLAFSGVATWLIIPA